MKKSFTLIEILISIIIVSILFLAMSNVINQFKGTKNTLKNEYLKNIQQSLITKVLYYDLLNAKSIKIINSKYKNFIQLYLQTKNSLYHFDMPYVVWYVSKNNNTLMRIENKNKIKLPNNNAFFIDKFTNNIKIFKIYKKQDKLFIYLQIDKKPLFFEMVKG